MQPDEKPDVSYGDIGGMDMQKQEMKEAVELPLTHFDLYKQVRKAELLMIMIATRFFDSIFDNNPFQSIFGPIDHNSMIVT